VSSGDSTPNFAQMSTPEGGKSIRYWCLTPVGAVCTVTSPMSENTSGWGTQSGSGRNPEYDRNHFYIHSTNKHNHSVSIRIFDRKTAAENGLPETVNMPPEVVAELQERVADPRTPYRSVQAFARDAMLHRLHDLAEMFQDQGFLDFFDGFVWQHEMVTQMKEDQAFAEMKDFYQGAVEAYAYDRNPHGIADVIAKWRQRRPPLRLVKKWMEAAAEWERIQESAEAT
jgi:hypothetical protein